MAVAEAPAAAPAGPRARLRGAAFGLDVLATYEIPALGRSASGTSARRTCCRAVSTAELERAWGSGETTPLVDLRHPDGRLFMSIDAREGVGYRVWAPRHGRHLVSSDGREVLSALPRRTPGSWERLLFAQTLPLVAALQGLEVVHASAIALSGRAVAFTAPSGTGKSSLTAHAVASGATFVTDDVVALELAGQTVLAHPGPARVSVSREELRALAPRARARLGPIAGETDKPHLNVPPVPDALPLAIVYRVARGGRFARLAITERVPPEPRLVLASSFLPYLRTPERLLNQLAVCGAVAASVRLFDLEIPAGVSAAAAASAALEHAAEALS